jgi:hypothetical protein
LKNLSNCHWKEEQKNVLFFCMEIVKSHCCELSCYTRS